jgi:tetratricopeptide (TPR) repeat protein
MLFRKQQYADFFFIGMLTIVLMSTVETAPVLAQSGINYTGNGGRNTIQGSIFFPSGRRADISGLKVKLESLSAGELVTFVDTNGNFGFKNLTAGSYYIVIEASEQYEQMRESVYIDEPGGSNIRSSSTTPGAAARIISMPIYLQAKRIKGNKNDLKPGVVEVKLINIPKSAVDFYTKALKSIQDGKKEQSIKELEQAIEIYPQFAEAYSELGSIYLKSGELAKAEEALRKTLQLDENNPNAQLNYGIALLNQRKMFEAEKALEKAVLADEKAATPHMYLGIALLGLNYPEYAEKEFLTAISLKDDEKMAQAHRYLGGIYWKKGNYRQAVKELERYLELSPKASDAQKVNETIKQLREKIK